MTYKEANGFFAEVNGHPVAFHKLPDALVTHATSWAAKGPHAIVFHYQAGCGSDLYQGQIDRGFPFIAFNVDQGGVIRQYMDARIAPWHCFDVSRYALGIEHAAFPGQGCELNDVQLTASAALSAALVEWTKDTYGIDIPVAKFGTVTVANLVTLKGFIDHVDITPGSSLNPTGHTDKLYHWTWDRYLTEVASHQGDDVTPAQAKTIADAQALITALTTTMGAKGDKTKPATVIGAAQRVAAAVLETETPAGNVKPHSHNVTGTAK